MCNLYSMTSNAEAIRQFANHMRDIVGHLPVQPGVFPDYAAPIVRNAPDGVRELALARWGMPSSPLALMESTKKCAAKLEAKGKPVDFKELLRMEPDIGTTNIRNTASKPGSPSARQTCCRSAISTSSSHSRRRLPTSPGKTRRSSTICCSGRPRRQ
jgi:putative SOS response-associated peptidase YedK